MKKKTTKTKTPEKKTPFSYKRIQEKNLPFLHANRTLLSDPIFYKVLNTQGFKWEEGQNQLTPETADEPDQLGFIDVETTLFIILKECAVMQREILALKEELKELKGNSDDTSN